MLTPYYYFHSKLLPNDPPMLLPFQTPHEKKKKSHRQRQLLRQFLPEIDTIGYADIVFRNRKPSTNTRKLLARFRVGGGATLGKNFDFFDFL
jgi:hypothetical protein